MQDLFKLSAYQYDLPPELIAQHPCTPRDASRLMVIDRASGQITEMKYRDLADFLEEGDSLVFNNTKVIPARLFGHRETGGAVEIFLLEKAGVDCWKVLCKPARKVKEGAKITFGDDFSCTVMQELDDGMRVVQFEYEGDFEEVLGRYGEMPLPHYIQRPEAQDYDMARYQTVYAKNSGAVAAPTAGLHFTPELLDSLHTGGIEQTHVTLHVGLGTFRPVQVDDIREHRMHSERVIIEPEAAERLNRRIEGKRQICVGTTCCRSLESAANAEGVIRAGEFATDIFIYPGYQFRYVKSLLTNFHLPGSTLLMLISAFAGYELTMEAYHKAVKDRYRFFSYGDAMLIL